MEELYEGTENGSSIEEMAQNGEGETPETPPIQAAHQQLSLIAGGEEPTTATMRMKGGAIPVEGEWEKGDMVELRVICRVSEIHFVDQIDRSGYALGCERKHIARVESVQRISSE